jgi:membrane protease subunit HflC
MNVKQITLIAVAIVALILVLVLSGTIYVVTEVEQVVITQFGEPVGDPITEPGLKIKVPFIQKKNPFDKRFIHVDTYARWRISDPLKFFQRLRDERGGQSRLDDILDGETRNSIAKHKLIEVVRSTNRELAVSEDLAEELAPEAQKEIAFGRRELAKEVLLAAQGRTSDLGIEILDFRFKRLNYVEEVRQEVYARMISERQRIAEQFRSEGAGESARINGERERELKKISSQAYREAQEIKGRADAEAADIYASAYNRDPEFYRFTKTMEVFKETMNEDTILLLGTDGEYLRYLDSAK